MKGSLNKIMMDDKGSTLICLFGLLPLSNEDDAARAILAGMNMIKALNKINNTYCNVGISSGECFSGVVGTSGSRKEFSVLGDVVNLAARIMGSLKGAKLKNAIRCDLNTRMLASSYFDFVYTAHNEFKGKSISIPTFQPKDPEDRLQEAARGYVRPETFLTPHCNPMFLEKTTERVKNKPRTLGFEEIIDSMHEDIIDYFEMD